MAQTIASVVKDSMMPWYLPEGTVAFDQIYLVALVHLSKVCKSTLRVYSRVIIYFLKPC